MLAKKNGKTAPDIEALIRAGRWVDARRAAEAELQKDPDNHWLATRLSTAHYELGDYEKALHFAEEALKFQPTCPLATWDRAGALAMLGRAHEAVQVYLSLLRRDFDDLAHGDCGEGEEWARGLLVDCVFRVAGCFEALGKKSVAAQLYAAYLRLLDSGAPTIYSREDAAEKLRELTPAKARRARFREELEDVWALVGA